MAIASDYAVKGSPALFFGLHEQFVLNYGFKAQRLRTALRVADKITRVRKSACDSMTERKPDFMNPPAMVVLKEAGAD